MIRAVNDKNDLTERMPEAGRLNLVQTQAMKIESWKSIKLRISAQSGYQPLPELKDVSALYKLTLFNVDLNVFTIFFIGHVNDFAGNTGA